MAAQIAAKDAQMAVQIVGKDAHMAVQIAVKDAEATKDVTYEARFHQLEAMMQSRSTFEVTRLKDVPNTESSARLMVKSLVGSGLGNAKFLLFLFFFYNQYY